VLITADTSGVKIIHFIYFRSENYVKYTNRIQGGSNMTGTDLCVNKPHCAAAVRP